MLLTKNRTVNPLAEDLKDMGIDAGKFNSRVDQMTGALTERTGKGGDWKSQPPVARHGYGPNLSTHVDEDRALVEAAGGGEGGAVLVEGEQLDEKLSAARSKGDRARSKRAARKERRSKPAQHKQKVQKGRTGQAKLGRKMSAKRVSRQSSKRMRDVAHSQGRRVMTRSGRRFDGEPGYEMDEQAIREEVEREVGHLPYSPFFEAAANVESIAMRYAEIFDLVEEREAANVMRDLREHAKNLAEEFDGVAELDEDQTGRLRDVLSQITKGIRFHDAMGQPSLSEACEYHIYRLEESGDEDTDTDTDTDDLTEAPDPGEGGASDPGNGELAEV